MRTDVIDFWILTSDLADLAARLRSRGWLDADNRPVNGAHYVRLPPAVLQPAVLDANGNVVTPAVMDTLHRIYVRLYAGKMTEEMDGERVGSVAFWTRFGAWVRTNGTWDEVRKGWKIRAQGQDKLWLVKETDVLPDHEWQ